jgi:hypothetical protein
MSRNDDAKRSRRERTLRIRTRLREIRAEDADMIALIAVIKGIMDIVDDIATEGSRT